jgi:hypothetical protein
MEVLPKVGNLEDESDAPWVYLAITTCSGESKFQGIRLVVDVRTRLHALQMGRSHYTLLTKNIDGNHYKATLVEEWAYNVEEAESLQWEVLEPGPEPDRVFEPEVVVETDDVTVIETKRRKKR